MRKKTNSKFYRLNYQITAPSIRLLDEEGKQIGLIDRQEALRRAQTEEKDLVEIGPNANPPVVKLIDFKKFKYLEEKKAREARKSVKHVGIKEIRLSPFIGEHDFKTRVLKGESFLKSGNQLKISVPFRGREIAHKEFGMNIIRKAINSYLSVAKVIREPYFEGKVLISLLGPVKQSL
ncbi:translation initiation factor IF-3 [Candidatus Gottesmanbacteria bacterium RIFCSPLOWO2_01_FULL_39_12b]|uniref:Translation initiation factor IF-3 n=1 Tax=Candidatus Gottesmanbacteria bacterium RIFCSPLOWO2_01_FULL_39_12b TaxID=1798388 RepID=A0A1F6AQE5_9BACT|nr:MAG: translation initiation factor IF-3 [Candidatus Gottesmanbacteria bacterium RIFCSPLOWO2_01_FULL_39_12b]